MDSLEISFFLHFFFNWLAILCSLSPGFFSHFDVHEVFPFWWHTQRLREKVHRIFDEFPIDLTLCVQEMPSRATDHTGIPVWQAHFALRFGDHPHPESFVLILDWHVSSFAAKRTNSRSPENGTFHLQQQTRLACYQVALIYHRLVLGLVGVGWKNFPCRATASYGCWSLEPNKTSPFFFSPIVT